jgi:hypothetical protein
MKTIQPKVFASVVLVLLVGVTLPSCKKKEGCTDPTSLNYDPDAEENDGSCLYSDAADNSTQYDETVNGNETIVTVTDQGEGSGTMTWTNDKTWVLNGLVFVNSGQTLTIEAGTVIKGKSGQGENASALVVARGANIIANGTSANPIIFTAEADNLTGNIPTSARGLWGGLIVLGNAQLNSTPGESAIEGIPTTEARGLYGGTDDSDNSGSLRYISIRHGGTDIGAGNEINGLTLGGVGSGTTIEYIEVISNADDGVEFFGGTASTKHICVAFCADDAFDYDEGYRGRNQFWVVVAEPSEGDRGGEHDGGTNPEDGMPYATPVVYNATYVGRGIAEGKRAITFRDNAGGEYHNSVFVNWGKGIDIEKLASGEDSYNRFTNNQLQLSGNVFHECVLSGTSASAADLFKVEGGDATQQAAFETSFATNGNSVADPGVSTTISTSGGLDLIPTNTAAVSNATPATDSWFDQVTYKGAFDPAGSDWLMGWTNISGLGYIQ